MASKLAQFLANEGIHYGDPFLVSYGKNDGEHTVGNYLGHPHFKQNDDHPTILYDFFCFYRNDHPDNPYAAYNDSLQLYDINVSNVMIAAEITRHPFWAPNPLDEHLVDAYLKYVEDGIVNLDLLIYPVATGSGYGIIPAIIKGIASLFGGNKNRSGFPINV